MILNEKAYNSFIDFWSWNQKAYNIRKKLFDFDQGNLMIRS